MSLVKLEPAPTRAFVSVYTALIVFNAEVVLDEHFDTRSQRLAAIANLLLANHDQVAAQDVSALLAPFGGANADVALADLLELYTHAGVEIDVHTAEHQRDVGPAVLYSTFTDYGDGSTFIEHYPTAEARLADLRQRATNVAQGLATDYFDTADEEACKKVIEYWLMPKKGSLHLIEAQRNASGEVYTGAGG